MEAESRKGRANLFTCSLKIFSYGKHCGNQEQSEIIFLNVEKNINNDKFFIH